MDEPRRSCAGARRRTYEGFAAHWPNASEEEQVIARPLNTKPKIRGVEDIDRAALKREEGGDLHVLGSTELVQALIERDLSTSSG